MRGSVVARAVAVSLSFSIRCYRAIIGPWLPRSCRFAPSCSQYALDAIETHGPWTGALLAVARLSRCHPWHPGGYDPVPPVATDCACASSPRISSSRVSSSLKHRH